ncbi:aminotransferase class I/II-fold pyridoxal phosphate-dependent enzyme, partial [Pantoea agglomerans]|uniref:aminotransferase class I/II-fold pyridoxal phosphate-dependent enzyme n=1 Tax=Enterobacter agglomerans TaxID=549 RepID=UPI001F5CCD34
LLLVTSVPVLIWVWYNMQENFLAFALASFVASVFVTQDTFIIVASSYSKNFGLYNERVGAITLVAAEASVADTAFSQVKYT